MKLSKLRTAVAAMVFLMLAFGLIAGVGWGTLSGFGLDEVYALCPLGALEALLVGHTLIPQSLVSLLASALLVLLLGRAFCAFICPVTFLKKIRDFFS